MVNFAPKCPFGPEKSLFSSFVRRPALWAAGTALSAIPTGSASNLVERTFGQRAIKALGSAGFDEAARRLLLHRYAMLPEDAEFDGLILIFGVPRVGKSRVAKAVAETLRMRTLSTDDLEPLCASVPKEEFRTAWCQLLGQICQQARGLVLEGKQLSNLFDLRIGSGAPSLVLDPDRLETGALRAYAIGCCDSPVESWEVALRAHGGWLADRGEDYLRRFANWQGERNRKLRDMACAAGVEYFDISREDFTSEVERAAATIVAKVRQTSAH